MRVIKIISLLLFFAASSILYAQQSKTNATLTVDFDKPGKALSPNLYGVFFEDINLGGDGGIYAEMIRNRSFEDIRPPEECRIEGDFAVSQGGFKWYSAVKDSVPSWKIIKGAEGAVSMHLDTTNKLNEAQLYSLRLDIGKNSKGRVGIENAGYYGISVVANELYKVSFYARAKNPLKEPLVVTLEDEQGKVFARKGINGVTSNWNRYTVDLKSTETNHNLNLVLSVNQSNTIWLDMVSMFPQKTYNNRENGMRADLMQKLKDMHPKFLRFPGGCVVEGVSFDNAIQWKETIGDIAYRPGHANVWGYRSTDGMGYHEFFLMAEDLGCEPLFVFNVGMTCQARNSYSKPLNELQPMIQDVLDAIEYANGPVSSKWGALRANAGHPKPFNLKYIEIGNENWGPDYDPRYLMFYNAIKAKYPEMITIRTAHPTADKNPLFFPENKGEMLDLHYYRSPDWLFRNNNILDDYPRIGKDIYIGEFACNEKVAQGNLYSALADASFMMAFERNADIVKLASYAPLLENEKKDGYKWPVNMIHFDNHQIYTIPTYYVQQMFGQNLGTTNVPTVLSTDSVRIPNIIKLTGGSIGFDTYSTESEFDDVLVISGKDTLLKEDFSNPKTKFPLQVESGSWKIENGVLRQTDATLFAHAVMGDNSWKNYTLTFKARRIRGNEGFFMTLFHTDAQNWLKWNIGGWNNTQHALELCSNGGSSFIAPMVAGTIRDNAWYKVQIIANNQNIKCLLNDTVVQQVTLNKEVVYQRIFSVVSKDENTKTIIIKMVNPFDYNADIAVNIETKFTVSTTGEEIVLTSAKPEDTNSFNEPNKVAPVTRNVDGLGENFVYKLQPHSLTFLKMKYE